MLPSQLHRPSCPAARTSEQSGYREVNLAAKLLAIAMVASTDAAEQTTTSKPDSHRYSDPEPVSNADRSVRATSSHDEYIGTVTADAGLLLGLETKPQTSAGR